MQPFFSCAVPRRIDNKNHIDPMTLPINICDLFLRLGGILSIALFFCGTVWGAEQPSERCLPDRLEFETLRVLRHDPTSYCQGLLFESDAKTKSDIFYESSGRYGKSRLKKCEVATGKTLSERPLGARFFAEGLAAVENRLYQLTWLERACFVYDKKSFELIETFAYDGEGWGLTYDGTNLILSDGTSRLRFLDPATFQKRDDLSVFYREKKSGGKKRALTQINELEYIEGEIWANIYGSTYIARIDPSSGEVIEFLNFANFVPKELVGDHDRVLNGIAWDNERRRLYLTGKDWPVLYELRITNDPVAPVAPAENPE